MPKHIKSSEIVGAIYGRLKIVKDLGVENHIRYVIAKCDCGVIKKYRLSGIRSGTKSCGCLNSELSYLRRIKHGMSKTRIYFLWANIKRRCDNPKCPDYRSYGGRGIKLCDEWRNFTNFYLWAINNGYSETVNRDCQIDRINNDGDYEPSNCRWVRASEQQRNVRKNVKIEYNGQIKCLAEWCELFKMNYKLTHQRIFRDGKKF